MIPVLEVHSHSFQAEAEAEAAESLVVPSARPKVRAKPAKSLEDVGGVISWFCGWYLAEVCPKKLHDSIGMHLKENGCTPLGELEVIWMMEFIPGEVTA